MVTACQCDSSNLGSSSSVGYGFLELLAIVISTFSAYTAWATQRMTQKQVRDAKDEHQRQAIDRTLRAALDDFHRRFNVSSQSDGNKNDPFLKSYESVRYSSAGDNKTTIGERYVAFRTANYTLKPLAYWCTYVLDREWVDDDNYRVDLKAAAHRILAGISSSCFVYLYLANRIALDELRLNHDGIERSLYSHKKIWDFLCQYVDEELEHTKSMNAGQYKMIESHLQTLGKDRETIRAILFIGLEQQP